MSHLAFRLEYTPGREDLNPQTISGYQDGLITLEQLPSLLEEQRGSGERKIFKTDIGPENVADYLENLSGLETGNGDNLALYTEPSTNCSWDLADIPEPVHQAYDELLKSLRN